MPWSQGEAGRDLPFLWNAAQDGYLSSLNRVIRGFSSTDVSVQLVYGTRRHAE